MSPRWYSYRDNPIAARKHGDTARRLFWQERRLAESVSAGTGGTGVRVVAHWIEQQWQGSSAWQMLLIPLAGCSA